MAATVTRYWQTTSAANRGTCWATLRWKPRSLRNTTVRCSPKCTDVATPYPTPTATGQGAPSAARSTVVTAKYRSATPAPASTKRPPCASGVLSRERSELKADDQVEGRHRNAEREV